MTGSCGALDCHLTCFFWRFIFYLHCIITWIQNETNTSDVSRVVSCFVAWGENSAGTPLKLIDQGEILESVIANSGIYKLHKRCVKTDARLYSSTLMSTITLTNVPVLVFTDPRGMCQHFVSSIHFKIRAFIHTGHFLHYFPSAGRLFGAAETPV